MTTTKRQTSFLQIGSLYSPNNRYDKTFIANYLDINVVPRIKRVEGVGDVMAMGDTYSMRIWLKPDVMAQYGLVPTDITSALGEQNLESPTGSLGENSTNTFQFTMKYKGRLTDISQFEDIVVRSLPDGNILRVKDVARVELGTQSYAFDSNVDGHPSCTFMVFQVAGSNATEVNAEISKLLSEINEELPEGLEFMTMMSSNDFLFASIHEVVETLVIAIILVILVVYFFLQDFKSTLIPSISIIVSLVGTFAAMQIAGFSINILTLFALVLVIGTVVDDSIVVVEAVQSKFDVGYTSPYLATKDALSDVTMAVITCTLVFMAVFIPVTFMGGTSGFFIHHRWISWGSLVVSCVLLVYFMKTTKTALVPQEDQGTMMVNVSMSPGSSLATTNKTMAKIENIIKQIPEVDHYSKISGYGFIAGQGTSYGSFIIRLKDWNERTGKGQDATSVMNKLNFMLQSIKEAQSFTFQPGMIPGYGMGNSIELQLQDRVGGDLTSFYQNTMKFIGALNQRPEVAMAYTTFNPNFPQYAIDIDAAKCKRAGISPSEVLSVLGAYCGGIYASNFNLFSKVYRIMIQADPKYRLDEKSLNNIFVRVNGEMAPISQFLSVKKTMGPEVTNRFNLFDAIACNVNPAPGYSSGQTMQAIEEVFAQTMPNRYNYEYGGISREEKETAGSNDTVFIYVFCIVLIFLILSCLYESFLVPMAVILSVPCGLMGSFLFAWLFGLENNIYLQTGVIMLIGLLAKTAILITEYATERRRKGMGIIEAAYSAAQVRFRPILMTVLTMIFGMLPLMFATGAGANGNSSLGTGVVGGMLIGTLALLFITPVFFIVFQYLQEKVRPPLHEEADAQVLAERQKSLEERSAFKSEKDEQ